MAKSPKIAPCLWFDTQAEDAARFYTEIFRKSRIVAITRYSDAGFEVHHRPAGSIMTVEFELDGQRFTALTGAHSWPNRRAPLFQVYCDSQEEIDYYWSKLGAGGDPNAQQCGWLKDRYGVSWQVTPKDMEEFFKDENSPGAKRTMEAMLKMKKLDIAELKRAHDGELANV